MTPLPHRLKWQVIEQPVGPDVVPFSGPSSQSSVRASTWPSPHVAFLQEAGLGLLLMQSSRSLLLPSSHSSPCSRTPLPHRMVWHVAEQLLGLSSVPFSG